MKKNKHTVKVKWINTAEALPQKSGLYLCCVPIYDDMLSYDDNNEDNNTVYALYYSSKYKKFNCRDYYTENDVRDFQIQTVKYWCELPSPPKSKRRR